MSTAIPSAQATFETPAMIRAISRKDDEALSLANNAAAELASSRSMSSGTRTVATWGAVMPCTCTFVNCGLARRLCVKEAGAIATMLTEFLIWTAEDASRVTILVVTMIDPS